MPSITNYIRPDSIPVIIGYTDKILNITIKRYDDSSCGVFYVDGSDFSEYTIEDYPFNLDGSYDEENHPCIAVHIATSDLINWNADYYIRIKDLTTSRDVKGMTWADRNGDLISVTTSYDPNASYSSDLLKSDIYNGKKMTYKMITDYAKLGIQSKAAYYATSLKLDFNGNQYNGFIGTRTQMSKILDNTNTESIARKNKLYTDLQKFGLTPNFYSGTSWWSSTQGNANYAWNWDSGSYWSTSSKTTSFTVLPFFAIR